MGRVLAAGAAVVVALSLGAEAAWACTCFGIGDPRRALLEADGAFIGTLLERRDVPGNEFRAIFVFRVDERIKGTFADTVEVGSASNGAACGLELEPGDRVGLFLDRNRTGWTSSLCQEIAPARLREAATPLPRPTGHRPIALLAGGTFGPYRTLALDARGRTIAYGAGAGVTAALSVCPGSRRAVEVAAVRARRSLTVRDLRSFRVVREVLLPHADWHRIACRDTWGGDVLVYADRFGGAAVDTLLRFTGRRMRVIWRGPGTVAQVTRGRTFICSGKENGPRHVVAVDADGRARRLARIPRHTGPLTPSPDGRFLAGTSSIGDNGVKVVLVEVRTGRVEAVRLPERGFLDEATWTGPRRFVLLPGTALRLRTFGVPLRPLGAVRRWEAWPVVVRRGTAFGVAGEGVVAARLPTGPVRRFAALPSAAVFAFAAVPDAARENARRDVSDAWALGGAVALAAALGIGRRFSRLKS